MGAIDEATENDNDLLGDFDAMHWAERFVARVKERPQMVTETSTMLAWFSAAIMAGYDSAKRGQTA